MRIGVFTYGKDGEFAAYYKNGQLFKSGPRTPIYEESAALFYSLREHGEQAWMKYITLYSNDCPSEFDWECEQGGY